MTPNVQQYLNAARRGAEWLISQQNPDGSFVRPDVQADVYHKAPSALAPTGHLVEANRLLEWIKANDLGPDGELRHFDASLALYKSNWICQGAHRLARFDISHPAMRAILRCQAPSGGFFQVAAGNDYVEPVCTASAGMSALSTGHLDAAQKAARCLTALTEQQPDERRFYYWMTPEGRLATEAAPVAGRAPFVDATKTQQPYYCPGIALLFLTRLHLAAGDEQHLGTARRLFEFTLHCAEDAYAYPTAGKGSVGAAILYTLTGDERARRAACQFGDYLLREQNPEGWWRNPRSDSMIVRLDHTAEFVVWLSEIAATLGGAASAGATP